MHVASPSLLGALALVLLVSMTLEWTQLLGGRRLGGGPSAADCADDSNCTADIWAPASNTCTHRAYPLSRQCADVCLRDDATSGRCNSIGACVAGDPSECLGRCESNSDEDELDACYDNMPLDWGFWRYLEDEDDYAYGAAANQLFGLKYLCLYHQCTLSVTGVLFVKDATRGFAGARDCLQYLNQTWLATHRRCVITERVVLSPALGAHISAAKPAFDDEDAELFVCTYRHACSVMDYSVILDSVHHDIGVT